MVRIITLLEVLLRMQRHDNLPSEVDRLLLPLVWFHNSGGTTVFLEAKWTLKVEPSCMVPSKGVNWRHISVAPFPPSFIRYWPSSNLKKQPLTIWFQRRSRCAVAVCYCRTTRLLRPWEAHQSLRDICVCHWYFLFGQTWVALFSIFGNDGKTSRKERACAPFSVGSRLLVINRENFIKEWHVRKHIQKLIYSINCILYQHSPFI